MKNFSHFRLIILAWLAVPTGQTATHITKILKTIIIIISPRSKTFLNKEMIIGLIQVNIKIISSNKMISIWEIIRGIIIWHKLNPANTNNQTILKTNYKTRWAKGKDIQWENFQANRHNKSSFINHRIACKTSQTIIIWKIKETSSIVNLCHHNNSKIKIIIIQVTFHKKIMIITNTTKIFYKISISRMNITKTNKTSNKSKNH